MMDLGLNSFDSCQRALYFAYFALKGKKGQQRSEQEEQTAIYTAKVELNLWASLLSPQSGEFKKLFDVKQVNKLTTPGGRIFELPHGRALVLFLRPSPYYVIYKPCGDDGTPLSLTLFDLYCLNTSKSRDKALNDLMTRYGVPKDTSPNVGKATKNGKWWSVNANPSDVDIRHYGQKGVLTLLPVYANAERTGLLSGYIEIGHESNATPSRRILPLTFWTSEKEDKVLPFNIPAFEKLPFVALGQEPSDPQEPVVVTDSIDGFSDVATGVSRHKDIPLHSVSEEIPFLLMSWYESANAEPDHTHFDPLKGRSLRYLVASNANMNRQEALQRALGYYRKLENAEDINFSSFLLQDEQTKAFRDISVEEFLNIAERECPQSPAQINRDQSLEEVVKKKLKKSNLPDYLIRPYVPARRFITLMGQTSHGKTWLGLSLAYAAATGKRWFDGKLTETAGACPVLVVDGELSPDDYAERTPKMKSIYGGSDSGLLDHWLVSGEGVNLGDEEARTRIERRLSLLLSLMKGNVTKSKMYLSIPVLTI